MGHRRQVRRPGRARQGLIPRNASLSPGLAVRVAGATPKPRETAIYALVVAKDGPKLKASAPDSERYLRIGPRNGSRNHWYSGTRSNIAALMSILNFDRPVIDKTGLTGVYDLEFAYTPEYLLARSDDPGDISLRDALARFGLKLEPQKNMIEYIVVDHAVKPSPN